MPTLSPHLSELTQRTGDSPISDLMARALANPGLISLAAGFVDDRTLPLQPIRDAATSILGDAAEGRRALQYGTTRGDLGLRTRLIRRLEREDGRAEGDYSRLLPRTVVTTGSQQLLYLLSELLLDPGDIVLVESPTYFVYLGVLQGRGARVIGVPTDSEGLCLRQLEETLSSLEAAGDLGRVRLIYTVSEHSNPSGLSLATSRRPALIELARRYSREGVIYVLEDSAYRGLTFHGDDGPSVWSFDEPNDFETVILARTFSKTLSPGLKTGFGVLPSALVEPLLGLKGNHDFGSSNLNQMVIDRVLATDAYERHMEDLRATYRSKAKAAIEALEHEFGGFPGVSWTIPRGGLYVWLTFPTGLDTSGDGAYFARCLEHGVLYVPGALSFADEPGPAPTNHARLCYGVPTEPDIREGVRRLAAAYRVCTGSNH